jgi:hypothetical protein
METQGLAVAGLFDLTEQVCTSHDYRIRWGTYHCFGMDNGDAETVLQPRLRDKPHGPVSTGLNVGLNRDFSSVGQRIDAQTEFVIKM